MAINKVYFNQIESIQFNAILTSLLNQWDVNPSESFYTIETLFKNQKD